MTAGSWFWILYVICVVFGVWADWPSDKPGFRPFGARMVIFVLIGLLGWGIFGSPLK